MNSLFRWSLIFQDLTLLSFSPVLGRQLPTELVEIALARADRAPEDTCGLPVLGHLRDRDTLADLLLCSRNAAPVIMRLWSHQG